MLRPNVKNNLREGRGFSLEELKLANLTPEKAKRIGIIIDRRRKSALEENVKVLKYVLEKGS